MIFHHKYSDNTTEFYPQDFHFKDIFTGQVCYSIGMYLLTNPLNYYFIKEFNITIFDVLHQGWLNATELYYGTYTNETFNSENDTLLNYDIDTKMSYTIPTAYFATVLVSYMFILILIAYW